MIYISYVTMGHIQDPVIEAKKHQEKEKHIAKSRAKAKAIDKAVEHCRRDSNLSYNKASVIYECSKQSISNHLKLGSIIKYFPDVYVNWQRLAPTEEAALVKHINECYMSGFPLHVFYLWEFANEILRARKDMTPVSVNWHLNFFKSNRHIKTKFSWPFAKAQVMQEDANVYIKCFEHFQMLCEKWRIQAKNVYNMNKSECSLGLHQKFQVIVSAEKTQAIAIAATDGNQKWTTLADTICASGENIPPFLIYKGVKILQDCCDLVEDIEISLYCSDNG